MTKQIFKCSAIVPAAGMGTRMKHITPKPLIEIHKHPILMHTLKALDAAALFDSIIVVVSAAHKQLFSKILKAYFFKTPISLVVGGKERQDSVLNGFKSVPQSTDIVSIHDGARPLVSKKEIQMSIAMAIKYGVSIPVLKLKPTIKEIDSRGFVTKTLNRNILREVLTPQSFQYTILKECLLKNKMAVTDEASMAEQLGYKVKTFIGSYRNIKITTKEDLIFAESIFSATF